MHHCKILCLLFRQCQCLLGEVNTEPHLGHFMIFLADKATQHLMHFTVVRLLIENKLLITVLMFRCSRLRSNKEGWLKQKDIWPGQEKGSKKLNMHMKKKRGRT